MALLLAPFVVGLLAVSCYAAPLQGKPQAIVTFPGDLISNLPDLQLAEVRRAWPRVPSWHPGPQGAPRLTVRSCRHGLRAISLLELREAPRLGWVPGAAGTHSHLTHPSGCLSSTALPAEVRLHHRGRG